MSRPDGPLFDYAAVTEVLQKDDTVKHLRIEYTTEGGNAITLFDDEVVEVTWSDGNGAVRVEGKTQAAQSGGLNLLEMLTGGGKARTEQMVEQGKAELEAEKAERAETLSQRTKAAAKPKTTKPVVIEAEPEPAPVVYLESTDDESDDQE